MKSVAFKHALANAFKYGEAQVKVVASKLFGELPEARGKPKEAMGLVREAVEKVNGLSAAEVEGRLAEVAPEMMKEEEQEEKTLPELQGVDGDVRLRLPPEPNGYLHIGHAMSFFLNFVYARRYDGELVLKFEDTNPLKEKKEFYREIKADLGWLGIDYDQEFYLSEHFGKLEKGIERLIQDGKAYVCGCKSGEISHGRRHKEADPCRERSPDESLDMWGRMREGEEFVVRWMGEPESDNSVLRDPTLYRVLDAIHPWTGEEHSVYPTYDFASAFTDGMLGITHVMRSEEFLMRAPLHRAIIEATGGDAPVYVHYGRFELEGALTSKRKIRPLVEGGKVEGWDDPRLATLKGLRRRGIVPKTFQDLVEATGPYRGRSTISRKLLYGLNRKNIDPVAGRFFVVTDPVELEVDKPFTAEVDLNPNNDDMGKRKVELRDRVFIEREDYEDGATIRLKGAYNITINGERAEYAGEEIIRPIVHWVSEPVEAELWVLDGMRREKKTVLAERGLGNFEGSIIQMERVGFACIDSRDPLRLIKVES